MENFNFRKIFSPEQVCRFFKARLWSKGNFFALEISQSDEESLIDALRKHASTNGVSLIPVNLTKHSPFDACMQTLECIREEMRDNNTISTLCSKLLIPDKDIAHQFVDGIFSDVMNELNNRDIHFIMCVSSFDYLSEFSTEDLGRLYNLYLRHKLNIKFVFLVKEGYRFNNVDRFYTHIIPSKLNILLNPTITMLPKIYISHKWGKTDPLVEIITNAFTLDGIEYSIDKKNVTYGQNIREYENEIVKGAAVLAVIDDDYLKSNACMYELASIFERGEAKNRLLVVLDVSYKDISETDNLVHIKTFWQNRYDDIISHASSRNAEDAGLETRMLEDISLVLRKLPDIWLYWSDIIYNKSSEIAGVGGTEKLIGAIKVKFGQEIDDSVQPAAGNNWVTQTITQNGPNSKIYKISTVNGDVHFD